MYSEELIDLRAPRTESRLFERLIVVVKHGCVDGHVVALVLLLSNRREDGLLARARSHALCNPLRVTVGRAAGALAVQR